MVRGSGRVCSGPVPSSKSDVTLRHKLHAAVLHANSLSFPETPGVPLTKARGPFPGGCALRGGVLPGGRGVQVGQVRLEGLKGPFLQWLPGLPSGPREKDGGW